MSFSTDVLEKFRVPDNAVGTQIFEVYIDEGSVPGRIFEHFVSVVDDESFYDRHLINSNLAGNDFVRQNDVSGIFKRIYQNCVVGIVGGLLRKYYQSRERK